MRPRAPSLAVPAGDRAPPPTIQQVIAARDAAKAAPARGATPPPEPPPEWRKNDLWNKTRADNEIAKKRARSASASSEEFGETFATAAAVDKRSSIWDNRADNPLHVPEDGDKVTVPDAATSSDVPSEVPCEVPAAGATALADDRDADLRRVISNIEEEQRNADREYTHQLLE
jgi:hypothetical protein